MVSDTHRSRAALVEETGRLNFEVASLFNLQSCLQRRPRPGTLEKRQAADPDRRRLSRKGRAFRPLRNRICYRHSTVAQRALRRPIWCHYTVYR
jgi:hypothetical protein